MKIVKTVIRLVAIAVLCIVNLMLNAIILVPIVIIPIVVGLLHAVCRDVLNDAGRDGDSIALECAKRYMQTVNEAGRSYRNVFVHFGKF